VRDLTLYVRGVWARGIHNHHTHGCPSPPGRRAETNNHLIRRILLPSGSVSTLAGTGVTRKRGRGMARLRRSTVPVEWPWTQGAQSHSWCASEGQSEVVGESV